MITDYKLYDVVEMKKPHPCSSRNKIFQIVRMGADIKIRCLGCGNYIMLSREQFTPKIRKILENFEENNEFLVKK